MKQERYILQDWMDIQQILQTILGDDRMNFLY